MIRTKFREDQSRDIDFLSEEEGYQRFLIREGIGTNDANFIIEDGYSLKVDGYSVNSLTISETTGGTIVREVSEIEFNDAYGFSIVDASSGKVRINFSSAWNPLQVSGQSPLDASGEEELEIVAGAGMVITTDVVSSPKKITFASTTISTVAGSFTPVLKIGNTPQAASVADGYYTKAGKAVAFSISAAFTKSGSGSLTVEGLPFPSRNTADLIQGFNIHNYNGINLGSTYGRVSSIQATVQPGSSILDIQSTIGDANSDITDANIDSEASVLVTGTYLTDSVGVGETFVPNIKVGGTGLATSYSIGHYIKNDAQVTVAVSIAFTNAGSGSLTIENLPFASKNVPNLIQGIEVNSYQGIEAGVVYGRVASIQASLQPGSTTLNIQRAVGGSNLPITGSEIAASGVITITGTYIVD